MADPSIRDDELALTLDHRCHRLAVHDDATYCINFAAMIEGIIKSIPETTSDMMESVSAARRAYVTALPPPEQPLPRDFDESRYLTPLLRCVASTPHRDVALRVAYHFKVPHPLRQRRASCSSSACSSSSTGLKRALSWPRITQWAAGVYVPPFHSVALFTALNRFLEQARPPIGNVESVSPLAAPRPELLTSMRALIQQRYVPTADNRIIVVGAKGLGAPS